MWMHKGERDTLGWEFESKYKWIFGRKFRTVESNAFKIVFGGGHENVMRK